MTQIRHHKNRNDYCLTKQGLWVRDFSRAVKAEDINSLTSEADYKTLVANQLKNMTFHLPRIDVEPLFHPSCIIVSDGYKFEEKLSILTSLSKKKITIIGVNGALRKWNTSVRMDYYVVNNPYSECMSFLPTTINYYPKCIASCRTHPEFIRRYMLRRGMVYQYMPTSQAKFGGISYPSHYTIDDYRNPVCAAIGLCFRWEVQRLVLFCCDDVFEGERPSAEKLDNGLYMYPQHAVGNDLIDGNLYWLKKYSPNVRMANYSNGAELEHASYIDYEELGKFF